LTEHQKEARAFNIFRRDLRKILQFERDEKFYAK